MTSKLTPFLDPGSKFRAHTVHKLPRMLARSHEKPDELLDALSGWKRRSAPCLTTSINFHVHETGVTVEPVW
eukprot:CAMPEP_0119430826 /NCGR_PEP_ID=MMETSP1335-20130426/44821_1 /TAXON_ID=259385 /ORGANISM="Chrysoculter rhomboideus, Strain RCC1486" /LENGTH=71 /DNA_ID=CAMNT_0007456595 /DNA_START=66 /DNA_END=278 /DNA_ORIENTATION=-